MHRSQLAILPCEWITKASLEFETGLSVEFESARTRSVRGLSPSIEVALCASLAATPFLIRSKRAPKAGGVSPSFHEALAIVKLRSRRFFLDPGLTCQIQKLDGTSTYIPPAIPTRGHCHAQAGRSISWAYCSRGGPIL